MSLSAIEVGTAAEIALATCLPLPNHLLLASSFFTACTVSEELGLVLTKKSPLASVCELRLEAGLRHSRWIA